MLLLPRLNRSGTRFTQGRIYPEVIPFSSLSSPTELFQPHSSPPRGEELLLFFQRQLGRGVRLEAGVADGQTASDRIAEGTLQETKFRSIKGSETVAQTLRDGVVALFGSKALCGIGDLAGLVGLRPVLLSGRFRLLE